MPEPNVYEFTPSPSQKIIEMDISPGGIERFLNGNGKHGMIGRSKAMQTVYSIIDRFGPKKSTVMVLGETGTGKDLVARAFHRKYNGESPYVVINCATIPQELLESELFGSVKGGYTDAINKPGKIEDANRGVLFLDEIGELTLAHQAKLLRAVENGEAYRVGANKPYKVQVRVISATNKDLEKAVKTGEFREDLYYRLNTIPINLPSLIERGKDLDLLTQYFLMVYCLDNGLHMRISQDSLDYMRGFQWPGNIRELNQYVERAVISGKENLVVDSTYLRGLPFPTPGSKVPIQLGVQDIASSLASRSGSYVIFLSSLEAHTVDEVLKKTRQNKKQAAEILGMSRSNFYRLLGRLGHQ